MHPWAGFGKNKHVDFHNLSSKSANSDFSFTLYVLARHYTTGGMRPPFFPLSVNTVHLMSAESSSACMRSRVHKNIYYSRCDQCGTGWLNSEVLIKGRGGGVKRLVAVRTISESFIHRSTLTYCIISYS